MKLQFVKYIAFIVGLAIIIALIYLNQGQPTVNNSLKPTRDNTYQTDSELGLRYKVLDLQPLVYHFSASTSDNLGKLARSLNYTWAINAGYFTGGNTTAKHAGLLKIADQELYPMAYGDPQISHVVMQLMDNSLELASNQEWRDSLRGNTKLAFQSGPLVMLNGVIQQESISASVNGSGAYRRTFLAFSSSKIILGIVTKPITLNRLAEYFIQDEEWKNSRLSLINLDGGTSTAFYSKDIPEVSFNNYWYLPAIIGVK